MTDEEMKNRAGKAIEEVQGRIEQGPVQEQLTEHSEVYDDMEEYEAADHLVDESKKAAKNRAWMWAVVVLALIVGAALFILMVPEVGGTDNTAATGDNVANVVKTDGTEAVAAAETVVESVAVVPETTTTTAATNGKTAAATARTTTTVTGTPTAAEIESEARRVIHGDFGNGAQRRAALGSHYAAVQHRVNELMHT